MKETELGPLPEDWAVVELGDISTFITSGPRGWSDRFRDVGAPFVRITNMRREMIALNLAKMIYVHYDADDAEAIRTSLRYGDLLISITADIGIISVVDERLRLPAFINQHIALVRVDESKGSPPYIARYLAGPSGEKYFRSITDTGAKPGLSLLAVRRVIFAAPPREEQNAIAEALGDVDTLLLGLDQLIEKKRAVKQAVMEQLLTGRRRLPGFSGEWSPFKLGDVMQPLATAALPRAMMSQDGSIGCIHYGDIHIGSDSLMRCDAASHSRVHPSRAGSASPLKTGDLLIADASEDVGGLGKAVEVALMDSTPFIAGLHLIALRPNPNLVALGFAQFIQYFEQYREGVQRAASGVSVYGLSRAALRSIEVPLPPLPEQQAIAEVLTALDDELRALDERRGKTQHLKRGMMASLLSGKVRLR